MHTDKFCQSHVKRKKHFNDLIFIKTVFQFYDKPAHRDLMEPYKISTEAD